MPRPAATSYKYYDLILALFAGVLLISNLGATKLISFGFVITDGGAVLFPLVYIFGDILTEVYGFKYARRAIWTGFFVMLLAVFALTAVQHMPPAPDWPNQQAYESVLGFFPRIVLAKLKIRTGGRHLWQRLIGSTVLGEFFDTAVFGLIAFGGILGGHDMVNFILIGWIFKTGVEIILLPVTYRVIAFLKRRESKDAYDKDTDFSPLRISL